MERFTKEELLQDIAAGNRTIEGLAAKYDLTPGSMKRALTKLEIDLKEWEAKPESEPIIMNNFAESVEIKWYQLYKDYDLEGAIGNQAQFMIAQCRIKYGMTVAQARQYMKDNFISIKDIKLNK